MSGRVYTRQIEPSSGEPLLRPTSWYANLLPPVEQRPWGKSACFVMFKGRNPNGKYQALDVPFKKFHRYMVTSTYCQDQRPNGQSHNTCWHTWTYVRSTTIKKKSILLPSRGLTYPTLGKGKSSSNMPYQDLSGGYVSSLEGILFIFNTYIWSFDIPKSPMTCPFNIQPLLHPFGASTRTRKQPAHLTWHGLCWYLEAWNVILDGILAPGTLVQIISE